MTDKMRQVRIRKPQGYLCLGRCAGGDLRVGARLASMRTVSDQATVGPIGDERDEPTTPRLSEVEEPVGQSWAKAAI